MEAKPYPKEKRGILIERNAKDFVTFLEEITNQTGKQFIREKLLQSQVPGFRKGRAPLTRKVTELIRDLKKERELTNSNSVIWNMFKTAWMAWVESRRELNQLLLEFDNTSDFDENHKCIVPPNSALDIQCFKTLMEASHNNQIDRETIRRFYEYGYFLPSDEIEDLIEKALPRAEIERQRQLAALPDRVNKLSEAINSLNSRLPEIEFAHKTAQKLNKEITEVTKSFESQLAETTSNFNKRIGQLINSRLSKVEKLAKSLEMQLADAEFLNNIRQEVARLDQGHQESTQSFKVRLDGLDKAITEIKTEQEKQHQSTDIPRVAHQAIQIGERYAANFGKETEHYSDENDYLSSFKDDLQRFGVTGSDEKGSDETATAIHLALKAFPTLEVADTRTIDIWQLVCDNHLHITKVDVEMGWLGLQDWFPDLFSQECFGEQLRRTDLNISIRKMLEMGDMLWVIHFSNCDRSFPESYLPRFLDWINDFSEGAIRVFLTRCSELNRCETNRDVFARVARLPVPQNQEPIEAPRLRPSGVIVTRSEWKSWCCPNLNANPLPDMYREFLNHLQSEIENIDMQIPRELLREIQHYLWLSHNILAPSRALDWALTIRLLPWIGHQPELIDIVQNLINRGNSELSHFRDGLLQASEENE